MNKKLLIAEDEIFKAVKVNEEEYPNYLVSNYGRVYSCNRKKILNGKIKDGRIRYVLHKEGKEKYVSGHRLVAYAFLTNPNNYRCINHKNEIPTDNRVENLEYCTDKYNLNYGTAQKRRALKRSKTVLQLDDDFFILAQYVSLNEAGRQSGISAPSILNGCHHGTKSKGYYWAYVE